MKRKPSRSKLIFEVFAVLMLVVLSFGGRRQSLAESRGFRTANDAMSLHAAIANYYSEYERLPDFGMEGDEAQTDGQFGIELLTILLGKEEVTNDMQNKKQITFLNSRVSKKRAGGGLVFKDSPDWNQPLGLYDAWGQPFHVVFDHDKDGEIADPLFLGNIVRDKPAIVFSYGPDKKPGGGDDIKTW